MVVVGGVLGLLSFVAGSGFRSGSVEKVSLSLHINKYIHIIRYIANVN